MFVSTFLIFGIYKIRVKMFPWFNAGLQRRLELMCRRYFLAVKSQFIQLDFENF